MQSAADKRTAKLVDCGLCGIKTEWRVTNGIFSFCKKCYEIAARELNIDPNVIDVHDSARIFTALVRKTEKS